MRRKLLSTLFAAALVPAAALQAAPNVAAPSQEFLQQISQQTYELQAHAGTLEAYVRSGSHDWSTTAGFANDMAENAQKLAALLDRYVAQPGTDNETRRQVDRMKLAVSELRDLIGDALTQLNPHALPLHMNQVFADTDSITDRGAAIRSVAQALAGAN